MAFKKTLAQRLLNITKISNYRISSSVRSPNPPKPGIAPDPGDNGIFRRFLHKRPVFLSELRQPAANTILPRLREIDIARSRIRLDGLTPPEKSELAPNDMRKLLRAVEIEKVKSKLRNIPESCITYSEFFRMCVEICSDPVQARSIAQMLDDSSSVIIVGDVVYLHPEQVAKSIQSMLSPRGVMATESERNELKEMEIVKAEIKELSQAIKELSQAVKTIQSKFSPRGTVSERKELEEMEKVKAEIDKRANTLARRELFFAVYGLLGAQMVASMRLTFWELSWDVMEPICYYLTSAYVIAGFTFYMRTSKLPGFDGIYQSRFNSQQKRLMRLHNFDIARYNELKDCTRPLIKICSSECRI